MLVLMRNAKCFAAVVTLLLTCALCAHAQQTDASETQRLFVPWSSHALDLELKGLMSNLWDYSEEAQKDAAGGVNAGRPLREFVGILIPPKGGDRNVGFLRIRLEPAREGIAAAALRDGAAAHYAKADYVSKASIKPYEHGQSSLLKFKFNGRPPQDGTYLSYLGGYSAFPVPLPSLPMANPVFEAYVVRGGTAVTFRYAGMKLNEKDELFFQSLLDTVRFVDAARPSSSYDHYALGGEFYKRKQHAEAVAALEKALALEQKQRALTQPQWRQLVMTLANALGATDDVPRAREVLDYGVANEPAYPYFHHGLSRLYSHLGDLDRVLASLEKAYQYAPKKNSFPSWAIPDPMLDEAFHKYRGEPRFRDTVKALKKQYKY